MVKIAEILEYLDKENETYEFYGNKDEEIEGFASLQNYKDGSITWIKSRDNLDKAGSINDILLAVIQNGIDVELRNQIVSENSKRIFFSIIEHFFNNETKPRTLIGEGTYISPEVEIEEGVIIGHNCTIDGKIKIGKNTRIYNNVNIINNVSIGSDCIIQSCVSIGHDGFGWTENDDNIRCLVKHYGGVVIGNNVHIGTNSCIVRGTIDDTVLMDNCKIDNLCHVAHNVEMEENVLCIAGSLLYGSVRIGRNAHIASAIVRNQHIVGENAIVGIGSVVTKDIAPDTVAAGVPAKVIRRK